MVLIEADYHPGLGVIRINAQRVQNIHPDKRTNRVFATVLGDIEEREMTLAAFNTYEEAADACRRLVKILADKKDGIIHLNEWTKGDFENG